MTSETPVPSRNVVVAAAALISATNGSSARQYCSGSGSPTGAGVRRDTGMCVCSGTYIDSKPRSSAARASSAGLMLRSERNAVTPMRITA